MAIKIKFDSNHRVIAPTFVLATKSGRKLGDIPSSNIKIKGVMKESSEIFFTVDRFNNGIECRIWNGIKDLKLVYCPEWKSCFEIKVEIDDGNECVKNVTGTSLGDAELSNILVNYVEINTEEDIKRDDYEETILHNPDNKKASLVHRILEKAPHYKIKHVDESISKIQRSFSFNEVSIKDAFSEISEDIKCYFKIDVVIDTNGKIDRSISIYDLQSYCHDCGERNEYGANCPKCGSANYTHGYGNDTTIFVSSLSLADSINYTTDIDSVKNCYKLSAGDDLMTATIANCNPTGSEYIWHFSNDSKEDMSYELHKKLNEYDVLYEYYSNNHVSSVSDEAISKYNSLVDKYLPYSENLSHAANPITGYPELIKIYYDTIDFALFLESGLMPDSSMQDTTAEKEAQKLISGGLEYIAVSNIESLSVSTASNAAVAMAKTIIDSRYKIKVESSEVISNAWIGRFAITNYSDEEDTYTTDNIRIPISDDYESFVRQKIEKSLSNSSDKTFDITGLFSMDEDDFRLELRKYSLNRLLSFYDACQACINLLIEQGVADDQAWTGSDSNLYEKLYMPHYNKMLALQDEIKLRELEIAAIKGSFDSDGNVIEDGMQTLIDSEVKNIQKTLNYENFLGKDLWIELSAYRREKSYKNSNYISDGLSNAELVDNAIEYIDNAKKEITKSSTPQPAINAKLKNLLVLKEFDKIVDYFELGSWIRLQVDNTIFRLRLTSYSIDFSNLEFIEVEFSDATSVMTRTERTKRLLKSVSSVTTNFSTVSKNASIGKRSNETINNILTNGISVAKTKITDGDANENMSWGSSSGIMLKRFDDVTNEYDSCQLKIYNSTISLTDNNWRNVKTAIGGYYYTDPRTGKLKYAYGINAEVLIGKLILGEELGIYNASGNMTFDLNGLMISNGINSVVANPNDDILFSISHNSQKIFYINDEGELYIKGDGTDVSIENNNSVISLNTAVKENKESIASEASRAKKSEEILDSKIQDNSSKILTETNRATLEEQSLAESISRNTDSIKDLTSRIVAIENFIKDTHGVDLTSKEETV